MNDSIDALLTTTYSTEHLHRKLVLIGEFFGNHFFKAHEPIAVKDALQEYLNTQPISEYLKNSLLALDASWYERFSATNYNEIIEGISNQAKELPQLIIYVATIFPPEEVEKLGAWARTNVRDTVMIDLRIDPNVVGGCSFVWNGTLHDYSFRYYFDQARSEVKTLLRSHNNA